MEKNVENGKVKKINRTAILEMSFESTFVEKVVALSHLNRAYRKVPHGCWKEKWRRYQETSTQTSVEKASALSIVPNTSHGQMKDLENGRAFHDKTPYRMGLPFVS